MMSSRVILFCALAAKASSQVETCTGNVDSADGCLAPCCTQQSQGDYVYSHTSSPLIEIGVAEVRTVSFPNLVRAGTITMLNNSNLISVDFPMLEEISSDDTEVSFKFIGNPALQSINAPALRSLNSNSHAWIEFQDHNITSLSMPKLESISGTRYVSFSVHKNHATEEILLPNLRSIHAVNDNWGYGAVSEFSVGESPMLRKIDASALTEVTSLSVYSTNSLQELSFPSLTTIDKIRNDGTVAKMNFPMVRNLTSLDVEAANCDDLGPAEVHICDAPVVVFRLQCTSLFTNNQDLAAAVYQQCTGASEHAKCQVFPDTECPAQAQMV